MVSRRLWHRQCSLMTCRSSDFATKDFIATCYAAISCCTSGGVFFGRHGNDILDGIRYLSPRCLE